MIDTNNSSQDYFLIFKNSVMCNSPPPPNPSQKKNVAVRIEEHSLKKYQGD